MGRNLGPLNIKDSYEGLVQISGSSRDVLTDGSGSEITNLTVTASNAVSASFATTASFALNATPLDTGSLLVTASALDDTTTFTKGDGSTFDTVINNVNNAVSSSYALTASFAENADSGSFMITGSVVGNVLTFNKGDGTTFDLTVEATASAADALVTASISDADITFTKGDTSTFDITVNNVANAVSASHAIISDTAVNATTSDTANEVSVTTDGANSTRYVSFTDTTTGADKQRVDVGLTYNPFNNVLTTTTFDGDLTGNAASADVATSASHAVNADNSVSASFATTATSASHALVADSALNFPGANNTGSLMLTGSVADATLTFTKGDNTTTFDLTVDNVANATNAVSASYILGSNVDGQVSSAATAVSASHAVIADSALSTPTATSASYALSASHADVADLANNATVAATANEVDVQTDGADAVRYVSFTDTLSGTDVQRVDGQLQYNPFDNNLSATTFTGNLVGNASTATSASQAQNAVSASFATTASLALAVEGALTNPFNGDFVVSGSFNVSSSITANNVITNQHDTYASDKIHEIVTLTQAEYDAIGTPDANSLYVISDATGSLIVSASYAISASHADVADSALTVATASYALTSSILDGTPLTEGLIITGSVVGKVDALSIASQTASLDCSTGNFFTLQLASGVDTHINPTNITPGQTINLEVATVGAGTVSFPSAVKQVSGSAYVPTTTTSTDIVTFISFDSTNLYLSNIKKFI